MYSFEQLMTPLWKAETVYEESLTMVEEGGIVQAPLLFTPGEILSVTSADQTVQYREGRDWEIQGNLFRLLPGSRIFKFREGELVFDSKVAGKCFATKDGRFSFFNEGHFFHDRQISVTYRKADREEGIGAGFCTTFCGNVLPRTIDRLRQRKNVKIVLYGDSIAEGANSSGQTLTTPFLPDWGSLTAEKLRRHYGAEVRLVNSSLGGMDSRWGMEHAAEAVGAYEPDLAVIAFGMNDRVAGDAFAGNIGAIRETIAQISPGTEFILCATTVPNRLLKDFYVCQGDYREALESLEEPGTAVADFYGMQEWLLSRKRFLDLTGNNVNHPNDFFIRCHAQVLSGMLARQD